MRSSCGPIAPRAFRRCSVRTIERRDRLLLVVQIGNRVADQRRGDRRAEPAMLDDRRCRIAWIVERHEGHEQRVVTKLPLRGGVVAAFAGGEIVGLGGSGLSRHLDAVERQFRCGRRSVIDHSPHRLVNEVQMILIDGKLGLRHDRLVLEQARNDALSGRKAAGHHRQLQRIDEDHALADRHVDGIVSLPLAMIFAHHPVGVGDGPVALVVERQIELLAESHRADHRRQLVRSDAQAHGVEIDVAAVDHRRVHIDRTMPPVAVESVVPELKRPGAVHLLSAVDAGVEQRHRHRRLDRRARRIKALQRLIDQRQVVVPGQHFPLVVADPVRKLLGSNEGIDGIARMSPLVTSITTTDRRLVADPPRRIFMKVGIDGQLDGAAAAVGFGVELLDQLASRGDFDPLAAGLPAERRFHRLLEAFLADLHAGDEEQGVLVLLLILGRRRRRHSRSTDRPLIPPDRNAWKPRDADTPGNSGSRTVIAAYCA